MKDLKELAIAISLHRTSVIHDTSILAFWCILTVISHTCDHARVTSKISFGVHWIVFTVHTNCDFLNNHTCDLAHVTSKIFWLTFSRSHILDNSSAVICYMCHFELNTSERPTWVLLITMLLPVFELLVLQPHLS